MRPVCVARELTFCYSSELCSICILLKLNNLTIAEGKQVGELSTQFPSAFTMHANIVTLRHDGFSCVKHLT